ncbi:MAG: hypothetical protein IKW64_00565 [Clostridia bacterium]|nr:hypothetical protein [Clostridia bacterium]
MANLTCNCKSDCTGRAIAASIIIGIITAILSFTAVITVTPAFLWALLGVAVVYLAVTLLAAPAIRGAGIRGCVCNILPVLITGILGTALTAVILLGIEFAATSIIGTIITGALLLFFSLILTATACLIRCTAGCRGGSNEG